MAFGHARQRRKPSRNLPDHLLLKGTIHADLIPEVDHAVNHDILVNHLCGIHLGEILKEEFLARLAISQCRLAKAISVPSRRITEIIQGQRAITADTALRLGCYFTTFPQFWMNLQGHFDLETERDRLGDRLETEVQALPPA